MENNEYRRDRVQGFVTRQEGNTLFIEGALFLPDKTDFIDEDSVKYLATRAVRTADGFYDLVKKNCNTENPDASPEACLEMYLSLAALTCEIYIKSIIYNESLHNGAQLKGHFLDELFKKLPSAMQEEIKRKIKEIEIILPSIKKMFETFRYDFELNHIQGEYLIVFKLMDTLREISHSYPKRETGSIICANGVMHLR